MIRRWLFNFILVLCVLAGLGLIFNKEIRNIILVNSAQKYQITNYSAKDLKKNEQAHVSFDFNKVEPIDFAAALKAQMSSQKLPVIGGIAVPDVGINLPIFKGIRNSSLRAGAGTMKPNQIMGEGNYALAGHNLERIMPTKTSFLFSPLALAKIGMKIYVTDKVSIYEYRIDNILHVKPNRGDVINDVPGQKIITLVTCYAKGTQRQITQGKLEKIYSFESAPKAVKQAFTKKYNQWIYH